MAETICLPTLSDVIRFLIKEQEAGETNLNMIMILELSAPDKKSLCGYERIVDKEKVLKEYKKTNQ